MFSVKDFSRIMVQDSRIKILCQNIPKVLETLENQIAVPGVISDYYNKGTPMEMKTKMQGHSQEKHAEKKNV